MKYFIESLFFTTVVIGVWFRTELVAAQQDVPREGPMLEVTSPQAQIKVTQSGGQRVLGTVPKGTRLWSLEIKDEFCKVMLPKTQKTGWISQNSVKAIFPSSEATERLSATLARVESAQRAGDFKAAASLLVSEAENMGNELGRLHPDVASLLDIAGYMFTNAGDIDTAISQYNETISIRRTTQGENHIDYATSLSNLAGVYLKAEDYRKAEPLFIQSVEIRKSVYGAQSLQYADGLNNLGGLYLDSGNNDRAESMFRDCMEIRRELLGEKHPDFAVTVNNLAVLRQKAGDFAAAESLFLQSLDVRKLTVGELHPDYALGLHNLAGVYIDMGDYERARPLEQKALEIRGKTLGDQHPKFAECLINLGLISKNLGGFETAEDLYIRASEIYKSVFGEQHSLYGKAISNAGLLALQNGDHIQAQDMIERAARVIKNGLGEFHPDYAVALRNLAGVHTEIGEFPVAESLLHQSLAITRLAFGTNNPDYASGLDIIAGVQLRLKKPNAAAKSLDLARHAVSAHVKQFLPFLPQKRQTHYLHQKYAGEFHKALNVGVKFEAARERSAAWLLNGKAVSESALAARQLLLRLGESEQLAEVVDELNATRTELSTLAMSVVQPENTVARQDAISSLTAKAEDLSRKLTAVTGVVEETRSWIELQQVRDALPEQSVLVDIARLRMFDFHAKKGAPAWLDPHYVAWITPQTGDVQIIDFGSAEEIDELVNAARKSVTLDLQTGGALSTNDEETSINVLRADLMDLAKRIWAPLLPHLGDANQIILSPDGALWLAPWSALPANETDNEFLLERYSIRMVISGRDLVATPDKRTTTAPVILANPDFDQRESQKKSAIKVIFKTLPPESNNATRSFSAKSTLPKVQPLPNTGLEALAIQPHIETYTGQKVGLYREQYALERVAKSLHGPQIVSFATHGFFLPKQETKLKDRNSLMADNTRAVVLDTEGKPIENPLLRCGLLLSGCNNQEATVGDDDGVLTGMEITGIDFRGTELVVLSACETGIGDVRNGEGVAGLRQAFQLAGAEAVLATLWQIPDRESAVLMASFFEHLADGQSKAEALRSAQLKLIETRRSRFGAAHPFYWAAFTLTGAETDAVMKSSVKRLAPDSSKPVHPEEDNPSVNKTGVAMAPANDINSSASLMSGKPAVFTAKNVSDDYTVRIRIEGGDPGRWTELQPGEAIQLNVDQLPARLNYYSDDRSVLVTENNSVVSLDYKNSTWGAELSRSSSDSVGLRRTPSDSVGLSWAPTDSKASELILTAKNISSDYTVRIRMEGGNRGPWTKLRPGEVVRLNVNQLPARLHYYSHDKSVLVTENNSLISLDYGNSTWGAELSRADDRK